MSKIKSANEASYDELPYLSFSYPETHPANLSTVARFFGLKPPSFKNAKVLEVGCAMGGNLFPIAMAYPETKCVGIDLSGEQIAEANRIKAEYGLTNIEFIQQDLMEMDLVAHKDGFDYIIAHGFLSWVPDFVGDKLFKLCKECLSPRGLALVSYNAKPGWGVNQSIREMLQYHTKFYQGHAEKAKQAVFAAELFSQLISENRVAHKKNLEAIVNIFKKTNFSYIYHDYLEEINRQFYLHEFVDLVRGHGLDYVGDSDMHTMYHGSVSEDVFNVLKQLKAQVTDHISHEQYIDFLVNRTFRKSIICKKGQRIDRDIKDSQIMDYYLTFEDSYKSSHNDYNQPVVFTNDSGNSFTVTNPIGIAITLEVMNCGKIPIKAKDVVDRVKEKTGFDIKQIREMLIKQGIIYVLSGIFKLHEEPPLFARELSGKPKAFPCAIKEALDISFKTAVNVMGYRIKCEGVDKKVLPLLDGTRTIEDIALVVMQDIPENLRNAEGAKEKFVEATRETLLKFLNNVFLVG